MSVRVCSSQLLEEGHTINEAQAHVIYQSRRMSLCIFLNASTSD